MPGGAGRGTPGLSLPRQRVQQPGRGPQGSHPASAAPAAGDGGSRPDPDRASARRRPVVSRGWALLAALALAPALQAQDTSMVQGGIYQRPFLVSAGRTAVGGYAEGNANYFRTDGVSEGFSMELRRFNIFLFSSVGRDRKSTRLNSSHGYISYAVFCLKKIT